MSLRLIEVLLDRLKEQRNIREQAIHSGACKDYAAYQHAVGVLVGISLCERELMDFQRNAEDEDNG